MGAVDSTGGGPVVDPTPEERLVTLEAENTQLKRENDEKSVKIAELEGEETAEEAPPPPPPPVESERLKKLKQEKVGAEDKLSADRLTVVADEQNITDIEQEIQAEEHPPA